jgi:glycosyltransferase involved in cell wall biosynthesis
MSRIDSQIVSPMATGNGAYVVHCLLERYLPNYRIAGFNPYLTLIPILLRAAANCKGAKVIHSTPDYAVFNHTKSVPLIITFHNYVLDRWMQFHSSWLQRIHYATDLRLWTRMAVRKASYLTAVSYFLADLVKRDLGLTKPVRVIYNGIDVDHFRPQHATRSDQKEIRVFFSGNLTRRKGVHWLPAIARRLTPNAHIYYTSGLRTRNIFASVKMLRPVGQIPFDDMPKRYGEMDILLMPTVREGFGLAVAEAMACGRPVVASDCSSIPELIDNGKGGFLCPVGDAKAFAEKINILAESPNLRREMGEYNRVKVEKMFRLDRMVNGYRVLFEEVLSE